MLDLKPLTKENIGVFMTLMLAVLTEYHCVSLGESEHSLYSSLGSKSSKAAAESGTEVTFKAGCQKCSQWQTQQFQGKDRGHWKKKKRTNDNRTLHLQVCLTIMSKQWRQQRLAVVPNLSEDNIQLQKQATRQNTRSFQRIALITYSNREWPQNLYTKKIKK